MQETYPIGVLGLSPSADPHFFSFVDDDELLPNDAVLLFDSGVLGTLCDLGLGDTSFMDGLEGKGELFRNPKNHGKNRKRWKCYHLCKTSQFSQV